MNHGWQSEQLLDVVRCSAVVVVVVAWCSGVVVVMCNK